MGDQPTDKKTYGWVDEPFIKLVPLSWIIELCKLPPSAIRVGLLIYHKKGITDKSPYRDKYGEGVLTITRKFAKTAMNIPPRTLTEGLNKLVEAGLITASRGQGKAIRVSIVSVTTTTRQHKLPANQTPAETYTKSDTDRD